MRDLDPQQIRAWMSDMQHRHAHETIRSWSSALRCAARELPYGLQATPEELLQWLATRRSAQTKCSYRNALRSFYAWAVRTGRLDDDPSADLPTTHVPAGQPRPVDPDDLALILTHARQPEHDRMMILLHAGLRCCDLAQLRREDVTQETIHIRYSKGGSQRTIPTHPTVWELVRHLPPGLVTAGHLAHRISNRIAREVDRIARATGRPRLAEITAHRLRHTAGTIWYQASRDLRAVQQLLGHASVATTQVYTRASDDMLRTAVMAMPPIGATVGGVRPVADSADGPPRSSG